MKHLNIKKHARKSVIKEKLQFVRNSGILKNIDGASLIEFAFIISNLPSDIKAAIPALLEGDYDSLNQEIVTILDKELGGINKDLDDALTDAILWFGN